jgi:hypothetical protein
MLKRVAFLGAIAALTLASPSHSLAQDWGGGGWGGGVTVHVGFPFHRRSEFCCERRFFPRRRVFCCEDERQFFPRRFRRDDNWNAGYTDAGYGYDEY